MADLVIALYDDLNKAKLAAEDLASTGLPFDQIFLNDEGLTVRAESADQAINVRAFLEQDGARSVEVRAGSADSSRPETIPTVPAPR